jgi:hypothetical protein
VVQRTTAASGGTQRVASSPLPHAQSPKSSTAPAPRAPAVLPCRTPYGSKARRRAPRAGTNAAAARRPGEPGPLAMRRADEPRRTALRSRLVLRVGAIAIVLLPVVLGVVLRERSWGVWAGTGVAMAGGLALTYVRPQARSLVLLGTLLAVLAGLAAPRLPIEVTEPTRVDLRAEEPPPELHGPVVVTGFFRDAWTMAEFAVPEGALPQQDGPAEAVLVPLLGVEDGAVPLRGAILVARVHPGQEHARGPQTVHGRAGPLEPELLATFVQASGVDVPPGVQGVLVDAVVPQRPPSGLLGALVSLAMLGAVVCLTLAARGVGPHAAQRP